MRKAVIIGATSGIGKALAEILLEKGYMVGLTGRRTELAEDLKNKYPGRAFVSFMDVKNTAESPVQLKKLIDEIGGMDLFVYSSGVGNINPDLSFELEQEAVEINVTGFINLTTAAAEYFRKQGSGHIVGISSVASLRGSAEGPAYNATKAFMSNWLEGVRIKFFKAGLPVTVTEILPGLTDTAMAKGEGLFWVEPVEKVAGEIYQAIIKRKHRATVTKRWALIAFLIKWMPDWIYRKL
ncbi:MAG: SDR family NAD(P)-dependent oxidoreductase [Firmicutes bacterium]|nr:SDR family NAD(P)-dependent oxidoreductase [Bacillota bacterium]